MFHLPFYRNIYCKDGNCQSKSRTGVRCHRQPPTNLLREPQASAPTLQGPSLPTYPKDWARCTWGSWLACNSSKHWMVIFNGSSKVGRWGSGVIWRLRVGWLMTWWAQWLGRRQGAEGAKICNDFHRDACGMLEPFEMLSAIIHSINETYLAKPVLRSQFQVWCCSRR